MPENSLKFDEIKLFLNLEVNLNYNFVFFFEATVNQAKICKFLCASGVSNKKLHLIFKILIFNKKKLDKK